MNKWLTYTLRIVIVLFGLIVAYEFKNPISHTTKQLLTAVWPPVPCSEPIRYSIDTTDTRFGLTDAQIAKTVAEAIAVWENASGKDLFQYSTSSPDMTVNFIYDYRQQATKELNKISTNIKNDRASYDLLKTKYDTLYYSFQNKKAELAAQIDAYNTRKATYQNQVNYWNSKGGAPEGEYQKLRDELNTLNSIASDLNQSQSELNNMIQEINSIVPLLNQMAHSLNLSVKEYNNVGLATGEEFSEAEYVEDSSGRHIDVYQFSTMNQLRRVLIHEFGHALGLAHVDDPKAIMYRLNQGTSDTLTAADMQDLANVCGDIGNYKKQSDK